MGVAKRGGRQRGRRRLDGQRWKDGTGSWGSSGKRQGELDGDLIGPVAGKGDPADSGRKDWGSEGLMDLAAWVDGDRTEEIVEMRGG